MSNESNDPIQIEDLAQFKAWQDGKPSHWAHHIAIRAALRVLPLSLRVFDVPNNVFSDREKKQYIVATFRAAFSAWAEAFYQGEEFKNVDIRSDPRAAELRSAIRSGGDARIINVVDAAAFSAAAAAYAAKDQPSANIIESADLAARSIDEVIKFEARSIAGSPKATVSSEGLAVDMCWQEISADVNLLRTDRNANLMLHPLWQIDVRGRSEFNVNLPDWARTSYDNFAVTGTGSKPPWNVWRRWYAGVLASVKKPVAKSAFGDVIDRALVGSTEGFWVREPEAVMTDLSKFINGELRELPAFETENIEPEQASLVLPAVDSVRSHSDGPTDVDLLGRMFFAEALVSRIKQVREQSKSENTGEDGYAVHLHAPWGSGKTTLWRLMKQAFIHQRGHNEEKWITVEFNAWRHQRYRPPWWHLIRAIKDDCARGLRKQGSWDRWGKILFIWILWKSKTVWFPFIASIAAFTLIFVIFLSTDKETADWLLGLLSSMAAAIGAFIVAGRFVVFGSDADAKANSDLLHDPLRGVCHLFNELVKAAEQPVCILIDDLDRCHSKYAVELLEGIQTAFRNKDVTYVIAADRTWLKAAYETVYVEFKIDVGSTVQPLGYLFLEKVFQVSTSLPVISDNIMERYWSFLLDNDPEKLKSDIAAKITAAREQILTQVGANPTREQLEEYVDARADAFTEEDEEAISYAAGQAINESKKARSEALHELSDFVKIVSNNPRVMKRMLNAYGLLMSVAVRRRSSIPNRAIARWTILEQRFPAFVDLLTEKPERLDLVINLADTKDDIALKPFIGEENIRKVIGAAGELMNDPLTVEHVRELTEGSRN